MPLNLQFVQETDDTWLKNQFARMVVFALIADAGFHSCKVYERAGCAVF